MSTAGVSVSAGAPVRLRVTKTALGYPAAKILAYLLELVAHGGGYKIRGVRGWADAAVIERNSTTWGAGEVLRVQARRGRILQHDVRVPGEGRPTWAYRICQPGADCLAEAVGAWAAGIRDPDRSYDTQVLLRDGVAAALRGLRISAAAQVTSCRVWIADEPHWRSAREINALLAEDDDAAGRVARACWSEDLRWLVTRKFAEELVLDRTHLYRLTEAGARLRPLEWRDPCG
jgi:hypothetical protein